MGRTVHSWCVVVSLLRSRAKARMEVSPRTGRMTQIGLGYDEK